VGRLGFFIAVIGAVAALAVFGWRASLITDAQQKIQNGADAAKHAVSGAVDRAEEAAAEVRVQQAAAAMEALAAQDGSPAGVRTVDLHAFDPSLDESVLVVSATKNGYCIQATFRSATAHATGPGKTSSGPCP
jgi:hypothetical protein